MNSITIKCNAKINLSLDVTGVRPDGYHNVELILNEISLYDILKVELNNDNIITLTCDDKTLPTDSENIAYRAAELFFSETNSCFGADITLTKRIPHGAGLAGGSADAAGVLRALNTMTGSALSDERLFKLASKLGADVPFCLSGGCAFGEGIGDILTPLPALKGFYYVIVKPDESISTAYVYKNLDLNNRPDNLNVQKAAEGIRRGDIQMLIQNAGNIMESVTASKVPVINDIKKSLYKSGAVLSLMSGSGTSVFGMFNDLTSARRASGSLAKVYKSVYLTL